MDWRACVLEEGDLLLRPWADGDADALGVSLRSPEIGRYFGRALDRVEGEPPVDDPAAPDFAVVEQGLVVGRVWFRPGVRPLEIGYFLHPSASGLATRGVRLVSDWLLDAGGEERIDLHTHPGNVRSQAVAERAGYHRDGEVERYARFDDGTERALRFVRTR